MRKKFTTYLTEDLIEFVKIQAAKEKRSAADIINELVLKLKEEKEKEK